MGEFEYVMLCFLIPVFGVLFYLAGKADIMNLFVLLIREKQKEIEERMKERRSEDAE